MLLLLHMCRRVDVWWVVVRWIVLLVRLRVGLLLLLLHVHLLVLLICIRLRCVILLLVRWWHICMLLVVRTHNLRPCCWVGGAADICCRVDHMLRVDGALPLAVAARPSSCTNLVNVWICICAVILIQLMVLLLLLLLEVVLVLLLLVRKLRIRQLLLILHSMWVIHLLMG